MATPAAGSGTTSQDNAYADLQTQLTSYGLGALTSWAWGEIVAGKTEAQVLTDIYETPQFKARFPAIFTRQAQGLPAISPGDYISYENTATQLFEAAGFPPAFYDNPQNFESYIANDMSTNELQSRISLAQQAAYQSPPDVQAVLQRDYGITAGDLTANQFLDPSQSDALLQQKFLAAQIGGAADTAGYGSGKSMDDYLASLGISQSQASSGFNDLAEKKQLFSALPGEAGGGISQDQQIGAEFGGDAQDQNAISQVQQTREDAFKQAGSYQSGSGGFSGIGSARTQ